MIILLPIYLLLGAAWAAFVIHIESKRVSAEHPLIVALVILLLVAFWLPLITLCFLIALCGIGEDRP